MKNNRRLSVLVATSACALVLSGMVAAPAKAASQVLTACDFGSTPTTVPADSLVEIWMNLTPVPSGGDRTWFYLEGGFVGGSLDVDYLDYYDLASYNPLDLFWTSENAGKQYKLDVYSSTTAWWGGVKTGSALCSITLTYAAAPTSTAKNFGKSDKTSDPNRDRKNFSATPKK